MKTKIIIFIISILIILILLKFLYKGNNNCNITEQFTPQYEPLYYKTDVLPPVEFSAPFNNFTDKGFKNLDLSHYVWFKDISLNETTITDDSNNCLPNIIKLDSNDLDNCLTLADTNYKDKPFDFIIYFNNIKKCVLGRNSDYIPKPEENTYFCYKFNLFDPSVFGNNYILDSQLNDGLFYSEILSSPDDFAKSSKSIDLVNNETTDPYSYYIANGIFNLYNLKSPVYSYIKPYSNTPNAHYFLRREQSDIPITTNLNKNVSYITFDYSKSSNIYFVKNLYPTIITRPENNIFLSYFNLSPSFNLKNKNIDLSHYSIFSNIKTGNPIDPNFNYTSLVNFKIVKMNNFIDCIENLDKEYDIVIFDYSNNNCIYGNFNTTKQLIYGSGKYMSYGNVLDTGINGIPTDMEGLIFIYNGYYLSTLDNLLNNKTIAFYGDITNNSTMVNNISIHKDIMIRQAPFEIELNTNLDKTKPYNYIKFYNNTNMTIEINK